MIFILPEVYIPSILMVLKKSILNGTKATLRRLQTISKTVVQGWGVYKTTENA